MSPFHHHHTVRSRAMTVLRSQPSPLQEDPKPLSRPPRPARTFDGRRRRDESALSIGDEITTMIYDPVPPTPTVLHASQVTPQPGSVTSVATPASRTRISDKELAFIITAALFGMGVLLLAAGFAHLQRRGRGRLANSRGADTAEQGLSRTRDFDESTWGTTMDAKRSRFQDTSQPPSPLPTPSETPTPRLSHSNVTSAHTEDVQTPSMELTAILEEFEQRLYQEETDIALALHIALGDEFSGTRHHCAPFFAGSEDDVTTMLSLQAGMESVGKRAGGIRNRARQGSDASTSSQSTTVTVEGFSSHSSSASSLTSIESMVSDIAESAEEAEEDVTYEVKRAQTRSMEIQKGKLMAWQPGGVRLMLTSPSTTTIGTASSSVSVDLDEFPLPP